MMKSKGFYHFYSISLNIYLMYLTKYKNQLKQGNKLTTSYFLSNNYSEVKITKPLLRKFGLSIEFSPYRTDSTGVYFSI